MSGAVEPILDARGTLAYSTACFGLFAFAPMANRFRALMPEGYTAVEFVRRRYGRLGGIPFLLISLFYALTWLVSMAMAGGKLLEVLSGIPCETGLTVVMAVCVLYTLFGGMYAVIGTDFIQSVIILVGLVVVSVAVLVRVDVGQIHATLGQQRPLLLWVMFPAAIMAIFNNMLFGLGEIFHSNVWWSRALAMPGIVGPRALALGGRIWLPIPIVAGFLGLSALALGIGISQADAVGPLVAAHVLGSFSAIAVFIIVFCSLASSIDSLLAATGDLLTHDVVLPAISRFSQRMGASPRRSMVSFMDASRFARRWRARAVVVRSKVTVRSLCRCINVMLCTACSRSAVNLRSRSSTSVQRDWFWSATASE